MSKDQARAYATYAFLQYNHFGRPTAEDLAKSIRDAVAKKYSWKSDEKISEIADKELFRMHRLIDDIAAVDTTFRILRGESPVPLGFNAEFMKKHGSDIADAVEKVYFAFRRNNIPAKKIGGVVRAYATESYCDERTAYRRLRIACRLFATVRGISCDFTDEIKISNYDE